MTILDCIVNEISPVENQMHYEYTIGSGPIIFDYTEYYQIPACGYSPSEANGDLLI